MIQVLALVTWELRAIQASGLGDNSVLDLANILLWTFTLSWFRYFIPTELDTLSNGIYTLRDPPALSSILTMYSGCYGLGIASLGLGIKILRMWYSRFHELAIRYHGNKLNPPNPPLRASITLSDDAILSVLHAFNNWEQLKATVASILVSCPLLRMPGEHVGGSHYSLCMKIIMQPLNLAPLPVVYKEHDYIAGLL